MRDTEPSAKMVSTGWQYVSVAEMLMHTSLKAIAKNENLKCCCGDPPYEDGEQCPWCFASCILDMAEKLLDKAHKAKGTL